VIASASNQNGDWDIYTIDVDDDSLQQLTHNDADDLSPSWSPDGAQIAFVSNRDGNDEIYSMSVDGGDQRRLTETDAGESFPAWSPDGTEISFDSDRDGSTPPRLPRPTMAESSWPVSRRAAAHAGRQTRGSPVARRPATWSGRHPSEARLSTTMPHH
jgi:dipeptidyl aminopeptidase/acylaminoacyl peptidase